MRSRARLPCLASPYLHLMPRPICPFPHVQLSPFSSSHSSIRVWVLFTAPLLSAVTLRRRGLRRRCESCCTYERNTSDLPSPSLQPPTCRGQETALRNSRSLNERLLLASLFRRSSHVSNISLIFHGLWLAVHAVGLVPLASQGADDYCVACLRLLI